MCVQGGGRRHRLGQLLTTVPLVFVFRRACVRVCTCVRVCVRACMRAGVRACVCVCVSVCLSVCLCPEKDGGSHSTTTEHQQLPVVSGWQRRVSGTRPQQVSHVQAIVVTSGPRAQGPQLTAEKRKHTVKQDSVINSSSVDPFSPMLLSLILVT